MGGEIGARIAGWWYAANSEKSRRTAGYVVYGGHQLLENSGFGSESAIGLAILVLLFRNKSSINVDELNTLKG